MALLPFACGNKSWTASNPAACSFNEIASFPPIAGHPTGGVEERLIFLFFLSVFSRKRASRASDCDNNKRCATAAAAGTNCVFAQDCADKSAGLESRAKESFTRRKTCRWMLAFYLSKRAMCCAQTVVFRFSSATDNGRR